MRDAGVRILPHLIHAFIRALHATLRVRHEGVERIEVLNRADKHYVLAFWHGQLMLMFFSRHRKPMNVMSSLHRDGEISARTQELFGADVIRGSSSRGGANALRQMIRLAEQKRNLAFTPDGPRGPRRVAQMGVVVAAQATGFPIVPVALIAKKKRSFAPGIDSRFRCRSLACCFDTARQSKFRGDLRGKRWKNGGPPSNGASMNCPTRERNGSNSSGLPLPDGIVATRGPSSQDCSFRMTVGASFVEVDPSSQKALLRMTNLLIDASPHDPSPNTQDPTPKTHDPTPDTQDPTPS